MSLIIFTSLLFLAGGAWLFDCGEGTVRQMISSTLRSSKLDSVFITHLHGDHVHRLKDLHMNIVSYNFFRFTDYPV